MYSQLPLEQFKTLNTQSYLVLASTVYICRKSHGRRYGGGRWVPLLQTTHSSRGVGLLYAGDRYGHFSPM